MRWSALPVAVVILLAGCGSFAGGPAPDTTDDDPVRYGIAVENDHASSQRFTVLAHDDAGLTVLNRTKRLDPGERWHVANLSATDHRAERYGLTVAVGGEPAYEGSFSFRESPGADRVSGATLVVLGGSTGSSHHCAGNVTCYRGRT
jgi:hypothetical protein